MSVGTKVSETTTCTSETDDGDYETSSEGHIRLSEGKLSGVDSAELLASECDRTGPGSKGEEPASILSRRRSSLIKSESMPLLRKTPSDEEDIASGQVVQTSESSLACQRKIKVIVAKMAPLLSSLSNLSLATSVILKTNLNDEVRKVESKMTIIENPEPQPRTRNASTIPKASNCDESLRTGSASEHASQRSVSIGTGASISLGSQSELINIAQNAHSSIRSFYFPPTTLKKEASPSQWRPKKDVDALLRIDGELAPLQHKLNEITGKFRAMNLADLSLLSSGHYASHAATSSTMSGYYLHRTEPFACDSSNRRTTSPYHQVVNNPSWDDGAASRPPSRPVKAFANSTMGHDPLPARSISSRDAVRVQNSCFAASRQDSDNNWVAGERDSFVSMKNSWFECDDTIQKDPSGSMIPLVSSSCYKCHRSKTDYPRTGFYSDSEPSGTPSIEDPKQIYGYVKDTEAGPSGLGQPKRYTRHSDALCEASGSTAPDVHVIRVNTARVEKHYGHIVDNGQIHNNKKSNNPGEVGESRALQQNVSSIMLIGSSGSNHARYVNITRVNSQTSLIISKRDQAVGTSEQDEAQLVNRGQNSRSDGKEFKDLDVQCSGFNLRYQQKSIVFRRSIESLLKPSSSQDSSSNSDSRRRLESSEKVRVVPVLFIDGMPEPPAAPLFKFAKPRYSEARPSHKVIALKRTDHLPHCSLHSDTSGESLNLENHFQRRLLAKQHWNNSLSLSVSRNSSLSCGKHQSQLSTSTSRQSEKCRRTHRGKSPGDMMSGSRTRCSFAKRNGRTMMRGLMSRPEDFLRDT